MKVLREITPLGEHDFMYVADRHKKEFDYPIHQHEIFELNFVMGGAGCRRVVGDSNEVIGDMDLVLITSPDLEHVWEQNGALTEDIHEVTVQFNMDFDAPSSPFRTNPFRPIYLMLAKAKRGLTFPPEAIMMVPFFMNCLSSRGPANWLHQPSPRWKWIATRSAS